MRPINTEACQDFTILTTGRVPQASFIASKMQQKIKNMKAAHIIKANSILCEMKRPAPMIMFRNPADITSISIVTLVDASNNGPNELHGQSGVLCGLKTDVTGPAIYQKSLTVITQTKESKLFIFWCKTFCSGSQ